MTDIYHLPCTATDLAGNGGIDRYLFLPGSYGRAAKIAERFSDLRVVEDDHRKHSVFLGSISANDTAPPVDVAAVATGMGVSSVEIIVTELIRLGARRLIRVGTAGSLQPQSVKMPSVVIATAAVRDEGLTPLYFPPEIPAMAAPAMVHAMEQAAIRLGHADSVFSGIVHTKEAFYAREFGCGPLGGQHTEYMKGLTAAGVLATEMEAAALFVLADSYSTPAALPLRAIPSSQTILAGAVLAIVGDVQTFATPRDAEAATNMAIDIALAAVCDLAAVECKTGSA
jgi:uridine phosphorylase